MRIAIFNWRDRASPRAGGAEWYTHVLAAGFARLGHDVTWFTSRPSGAPEYDTSEGYRIIRRGNELTCRLYAAAWLFAERASIDLAIDEVNTLPWLTPLIVPGRAMLLIHQLAREVWFAEAPQPLSTIGYLLEPAFIQIYRSTPLVTISKSSASTLRAIGLRGPLEIVESPLDPPAETTPATEPGLVGYFGRLAPSKRIDHIIRAVALARASVPEIKLLIIGGGADKERARLVSLARSLGISDRVTFSGRVDESERDALLSRLDVLAMASLREGWGIVVSDAARFGVPAVVYPVPGLVDSVQHDSTGIVAANQTPRALADGLERITLDRTLRDDMGARAKAYIAQFGRDRFIERAETAFLKRGEARP